MLSRNHPDRIQITFDDRRLVANAGLLLPATLARHLGLPELVQQRLDLGDAPGRANAGDKMPLITLDAGGVARQSGALAATALTTPIPARGGRSAFWAGQGAMYLPAQLPVGPRPSTRPGEPRVAGPGLGRWGRTRRRAPDH